MDRVSLHMTQPSNTVVWRCLESSFFMCSDTFVAKRYVWRVYRKFHALHCFFICLGFLETCERSEPACPWSDDCELASESICCWSACFEQTLSFPDIFKCSCHLQPSTAEGCVHSSLMQSPCQWIFSAYFVHTTANVLEITVSIMHILEFF